MPHAAARRALTAIALAAALAAAPALAQKMYKWVDEKGVTHFSEQPPPDGRKAAVVEHRFPPPALPPGPPDGWKQREQDARKQRLEKAIREEHDEARAKKEEAQGRERCRRARRALDVLEVQVPVYSLDDKGRRVYLEDKDREAEMAAWKREAEKYCG